VLAVVWAELAAAKAAELAAATAPEELAEEAGGKMLQ
jgi:hypothetical protein